MATGYIFNTKNNSMVPLANFLKQTKQIAMVKTTDITATATVGASLGTYTVSRAVATFYADSNNIWHMKFNVAVVGDSGLRSDVTINFVNAVFKNVSNFYQSASLVIDTPTIGNAYAEPGTGNIIISHAEATTSTYSISGDLELNADPTAYTLTANMEAAGNVVAYIPPASATTGGVVTTGDQIFLGQKSFKLTNDASLGSELITTTADRDFSSDSGHWTAPAGWTIGGGVMTHTAGANNATLAGYSAIIGATYRIVFTVNTTTTGLLYAKYGNGGTSAAGVGRTTGTLTAYEIVVVATTTDGLVFVPDATWAGTIDDVSVKMLTASSAGLSVISATAGTTGIEGRAINGDLYSIGLGTESLKVITSGLYNVGIGGFAARYITSGTSNIAIGTNALANNTTGNNNTALSRNCLRYNITGNYNTAVGYNTLSTNTIGSYNTAIGSFSLDAASEAIYNTAIGYNALTSATIGGVNTAIGYAAGNTLTTGANNTYLGAASGYSNSVGGSNICIGYFAGAYNTGNSKLYIDCVDRANTASDDAGAIITGTMDVTPASQILRFNAKVGIGTGTPSTKLDVEGSGNTPLIHINDTDTGKASLAFQNNGTQVAILGLTGLIKGTSASDLGIFAETGYGISLFTDGSSTEKVTILANGKVGIGTASPSYALDVRGTATGADVLRLTDIHGVSSGGWGPYLRFWGVTNDTGPVYTELGMLAITKHNSTQGDTKANISFNINDGSSVVERMKMQYDGKIGIGTSVVGSINSLLDVYANTASYNVVNIRNANISGVGLGIMAEQNNTAHPLYIADSASAQLFSVSGLGKVEQVSNAQVNLTLTDVHGISSGGWGPSIFMRGCINNTGPVLADFAAIQALKENGTPSDSKSYMNILVNNGSGLYNAIAITSLATTTIGDSSNSLIHRIARTYPAGTVRALEFKIGALVRGGVDFNGTTLSYVSDSDIRLKKDIQDYGSALNDILKVKPRKYVMRENDMPSEGFVAQELQEVFPQYVSDIGSDSYLAINYAGLVVPLVKAMQEQQAQIELLKQEIATLKGE